MLWDALTYPCRGFLILAPKSPYFLAGWPGCFRELDNYVCNLRLFVPRTTRNKANLSVMILSDLILTYLFLSSAASHIADIIVVTTDLEPPAESGYNIEHLPYRVCGSYPGTPPTKTSIDITCNSGQAIGRYVYFYLPKKNHMTLAEVEVYGLRKLNCRL